MTLLINILGALAMALIAVIGTTVAIVLAPFTLAAAFAARRNPENLATPFNNVCQHPPKRVRRR